MLETILPRKRRASFREKPAVPSLVHEAQVTTLINLAARLTAKAARIRMGTIGAWPGQIPLLLWLLEQDGLIQKELVQRSSMEQSTVAEHLERMERDGLVCRQRGTEDRRQYRFFLTDEGRRTTIALVRTLESGARTFTRGIPKADLDLFEQVLRQIIERLDAFVAGAVTAARASDQRRRRSRSARPNAAISGTARKATAK
jgi:MarR family transcriptional regulator, transcriptional regulator for hemolysin